MKQLIILLILSQLIVACQSKPQGAGKASTGNSEIGKTESGKAETVQKSQTTEPGMWKIASYAGDLGDNKNSNYITNTYAIWGNYSNSTSTNTELKVKFLIDKVSFCFKMYEYGKKIVKKGDETFYTVTVKSVGSEPIQITAKNVSDRIFISGPDSKKIIELFDKGNVITFTLVSDSKTNPASYVFNLDHPEGFSDAINKISN
jgi:hypothetical protein